MQSLRPITFIQNHSKTLNSISKIQIVSVFYHLFLTEFCKLFIRMPFGLIFNNSEQICYLEGLQELIWEPV